MMILSTAPAVHKSVKAGVRVACGFDSAWWMVDRVIIILCLMVSQICRNAWVFASIYYPLHTSAASSLLKK